MRKSGTSDVVIDLLVPARFASRYRATVTSISALDAEVRFAFCPRLFGSGVLVSCPATLSLVRGPNVLACRGILWIGDDAERTSARFQFEVAISQSQVDLVRRACDVAAPPLPMVLERTPVAVGAERR